MDQLSHDLQSEMLEEKGFSESNMRYVYRFYKLYNQEIVNFPQGAENFASANLLQGVDELQTQNRPQPAGDLLTEICSILGTSAQNY